MSISSLRKKILPPIFGIGGFLLFWQLSASLGLTKLAGPLSLFTEERTRDLLSIPSSIAAASTRACSCTR